MTPDDLLRLSKQLQTDEGCKLYAYTDTLGFLTIGYGRLIDRRKGGQISLDEAAYLLQNDVSRVTRQLEQYAWYSGQDSVRQAALANMAFNLGTEGLLHFPHFLGYMLVKDYVSAIKELTDTPWHTQVGVRADRIINLIKTGAWS
jgi:lysozyme